MWHPRLIQTWNRLYRSIYVKPTPVKKGIAGFACQSLCGNTLNRPHLTCAFCRARRVYYKKMPSKFPVMVYQLYIDVNRKHAKIKNILLKPICTIAEMLAN